MRTLNQPVRGIRVGVIEAANRENSASSEDHNKGFREYFGSMYLRRLR